MISLSTHVLDLSAGRPGVGIGAVVEEFGEGGWRERGRGETDADGRIGDLGSDLRAGRYRIRFATGEAGNDFFPEVIVVCNLDASEEHYHIPLLLSPFGYTTYQGS